MSSTTSWYSRLWITEKATSFPWFLHFLFVCLDGIYKSCSLHCAVLWLTQKCSFLSLFPTKLYWNKRYLCQNNLSWDRNILCFVKLVPSLLVVSQVGDSIARGVSVVSGHESKRCCNEELLSLKGPHVFRKILTWEMCLRRGFRACEPMSLSWICPSSSKSSAATSTRNFIVWRVGLTLKAVK